MWNPLPNWEQQGSYVQPVPPPDMDPDTPPFVCVRFSASWLPYVLGSLLQLVQPSTWDADDAGVALAQARATDLIAIMSNGCGCVDLRMRLQSCELQFSVDGGTTWTAVSNWDAGIHDCVLSWIPPPVPVSVVPVTNDQRACNIAGWLAHEFIRVSISITDDRINDNNRLLVTFQALTALFSPFSTFVNPALSGANALVSGITQANLADFQAAVSDPNFWSDLTCTIFQAIRNPGYLTPTNYPTMISDIASMGYAHPEVPALLAAYIQDLGYNLVLQMMAQGAIDAVDCSNCGTWCFQWNFPVDQGSWTINADGQGGALCGNGICGTEVNTGTPNAYNGLEIIYNFAHPTFVSAVKCFVFANEGSNPNVGPGAMIVKLAGNVVASASFDDGPTPLNGHEQALSPINATIDQILFAFRRASGASVWLSAAGAEGVGPNPLGENNCTF